VGDTLTIETTIDPRGDLVTGVVVLLSLDDRVLEPIIPDTQAFRPRLFEPGTFFSNATVFNNDLLYDEPGDPFANTLPFYQFRYFENAQPSPLAEVILGTDLGVLARFRVLVISDRATEIVVDEVSKSGWNPGISWWRSRV
tara:strand:- start:53 stop:475 length:423 start_codon:yes stop_codon:yes gene_type:complete